MFIWDKEKKTFLNIRFSSIIVFFCAVTANDSDLPTCLGVNTVVLVNCMTFWGNSMSDARLDCYAVNVIGIKRVFIFLDKKKNVYR